MNRVALDHVSVRFGSIRALEDVKVHLSRGEVLMLAGPNGAGKSTLIHVLLGLVRPQDGRLEVDGVARSVDNAFKRQLAYLPEAVAFAENLTGHQVLRFFASARGMPRRRIDAVLQRVGLESAARRSVRGYSRGMRQRLGMGVAILAETPLLILDEPTGGLDQEGLGVLWSILEEWRENGRMVLLASHDLSLMERRVDRVCVLRHGRILAVGTPQQLRREAALPIRVEFDVSTLSAGRTGFENALRERGSAPLQSTQPDLVPVEIGPEELLPLMNLPGRFPGVVEAVRVEEPGLDQVYEQLLRGES